MEDSSGVVFISTGDRLLLTNIHDGNPDPTSILEAKQTKQWPKWWEAISTELKNMEENDLWEIVNRKDVPSGRKSIGNRWAFAFKDDGRYHARTVAKGYSQIPCKDFQENFPSVINDSTFNLVHALKAMMCLQAGQFDVETAFLHGDLEEALWMVLPDGYDKYYLEHHDKHLESTKQCLKLKQYLFMV